MRLAGKIAIVTGAGSGIGRACAERFAREGACVVAADIDAAAAAAACARIAHDGGRSLAIGINAACEAEVRVLVERTVETFGAPTILLNSAATTGFGALADTPVDELDRVLSNNVRSTWLCAHAVIALMRTSGGAIVNMASIAGIVGAAGMAAYATSKGALISMTRTLALEHAEHGIRVNCICPGSIDTPMLQASFERSGDAEAARARNVARHPLGRLGTPDEVASLALFLASDEASFITGSTCVIDGGALIARRWQD